MPPDRKIPPRTKLRKEKRRTFEAFERIFSRAGFNMYAWPYATWGAWP
jgi:hypothetical protein